MDVKSEAVVTHSTENTTTTYGNSPVKSGVGSMGSLSANSRESMTAELSDSTEPNEYTHVIVEHHEKEDVPTPAVNEVYILLARQLEYYFSPQNLLNDTYLQTLRELNDGCVPVSILANFSKVKLILSKLKHLSPSSPSKFPSTVQITIMSNCDSALNHTTNGPSSKQSPSKAQRLLEEEKIRMDAILYVVNRCYCDRLQIYSIDTQTGKIASPISKVSNTIVAIGLTNEFNAQEPKIVDCKATVEPIVVTSTGSTLGDSAAFTNTLILRDVDSCVSEQEIRSLLDSIHDCPVVKSIIPDVANSWYVSYSYRFHFSMAFRYRAHVRIFKFT
jgi:hypothetical protein